MLRQSINNNRLGRIIGHKGNYLKDLLFLFKLRKLLYYILYNKKKRSKLQQYFTK